MAASSNDTDLDCGGAGEERTLTNTDVTLIEVGYVVIPVDFINAVETAFFDHRQSATGTLFSWLIENSDSLLLRDLMTLCDEDLSYTGNCGHVSVVAAHMGKLGLCLVF